MDNTLSMSVCALTSDKSVLVLVEVVGHIDDSAEIAEHIICLGFT
jgi:hypothetical protein